MKTAEEMYNELDYYNQEAIIKYAKDYAKEVSRMALMAAACNACVKGIPLDAGGYLKMVDTDSILNTEIITP